MTLLSMDVEVTGESFGVHASEVERSCVCSGGVFPAPGTCVSYSDAFGCDCEPPPASCIDEVRVERDGVVLGRGRGSLAVGYFSSELSSSPFAPGTELIIKGCGGRASIDLALSEVPRPEIIGVEQTETSLVVEWSTTGPSTSALVSTSASHGGIICHQDDDGLYQDPDRDGSIQRVSVKAFVRRDAETSLGSARIWLGGRDSERLY